MNTPFDDWHMLNSMTKYLASGYSYFPNDFDFNDVETVVKDQQ